MVTSIFESSTSHLMTLSNVTSQAEPASDNTMIIEDISQSSSNLTPSSISETATRGTDSTALVNNAGDNEVERGRSLQRRPRVSNPFAQAESRGREHDVAAIELDARPLGRLISRSSTFHGDPFDPSAILDDQLLEPCPHESLCNDLSEVLNIAVSLTGLSRSKTRANSDALNIPSRSRATSSLQRAQSPTVYTTCPECNKEEIIKGSNGSRQELRAEAKLDAGANRRLRPSTSQRASIAASMPTEILHQIFYSLRPTDFHAARHICRSWFINSLNRSLLETMIRRGGYCGSICQDMASNRVLDSHIKVNDEWLMSKRLARECALGPDWAGNGLKHSYDALGQLKTKAFKEIARIDFAEMSIHDQGTNSVGTMFTGSNCGKFLMAANGCVVYIYELNRSRAAVNCSSRLSAGGLNAVTAIICPHRVLACSMDTSSHRYAIAILLEGRMGMVCDITTLNRTISRASQSRTGRHQKSGDLKCAVRGTSLLDRVSLHSFASHLTSGGPSSDPRFVFPGRATPDTSFTPTDGPGWQHIFQGDNSQTPQPASPSSRHPSLPKVRKPRNDSRLKSILPAYQEAEIREIYMPIETGPRSLYQNLCSEDDPPRSVALCPQRRCVAFGCYSGIELHWVDALTGEDLNRWFPLTAPSDYLFFLPPRRSIDSAKKLRLISSAAKPGERPANVERAYGSRTRRSPFWERVRTTSSTEASLGPQHKQGLATRLTSQGSNRMAGLGRTQLSDHYRAVPISDGYHILFTDPATGQLCLGSDAPVGGPTKLLRKIRFQGPEKKGYPTTYASGSDLKWGIRVVAAFGTEQEQSIWLFSVPADVFTAEPSHNLSGAPEGWSNGSQNWDWVDWWPENHMQDWFRQIHDPVPGLHPRVAWPVNIKGQEIGICDGITNLVIDSGPDMTIWAFSKTGMAKAWKIDAGKEEELDVSFVVRDGTIRKVDDEGDIGLSGPFPSFNQNGALHYASFDGASSPLTTSLPDITRRGFTELSQHTLSCDSSGDVLIEDEIPVSSFGCLPVGVLGGNWRWSPLEGTSVDLVEELTGATRIDIEIR
ncbi:hypothetical protein BJ875DRAFT_437335 [Amylocarpus encephaloides]|uniref:F-box domain-containing protein n=1 Tax=Amylocarpus encephaloides TaxID=45428 RepID=A0A9P7YRP4_9HELO|nr:hypothetical protein BJ875DRAFT_437335 [Amylocarpus encephaloides]